DAVADVVDKAGNARKLDGARAVAQRRQDVGGHFGRDAGVGKAVFGKAQLAQNGVSLFDIGPDGGVVFYVVKSQHNGSLRFGNFAGLYKAGLGDHRADDFINQRAAQDDGADGGGVLGHDVLGDQRQADGDTRLGN